MKPLRKIVVNVEESMSPVILDGDQKLEVITSISFESILSGFVLLGKLSGLSIYQDKHLKHIFVGMKRQGAICEEFDIVLKLEFKSKPTIEKIPQIKNFLQVAYVQANIPDLKGSAKGIAKPLYNFIAQKINLVSDMNQYPLAKKLWKSLARESDINIYVYDGNIKDYVRNIKGEIIKYNSKNLDDSKIWSVHNMYYEEVLLIATSKQLM